MTLAMKFVLINDTSVLGKICFPNESFRENLTTIEISEGRNHNLLSSRPLWEAGHAGSIPMPINADQ